jgi:hypothetical protein
MGLLLACGNPITQKDCRDFAPAEDEELRFHHKNVLRLPERGIELARGSMDKERSREHRAAKPMAEAAHQLIGKNNGQCRHL